MDKEKSLATVKLELEKVKVERADVEAKVVEVYQDAFVDMPEYQDLAKRLMTICRVQLMKRIMETHPEWDIFFLHEAPVKAPAFEAVLDDNRDGAEGQATPLITEEGPSCPDP
ncbi:hypothetical protein Adt_03334 [Abeliophyllum distichum]|uniref:Uncharacterized protein n=1 Tax=Abeliophyllum distichum TaxID=126358 RepID=A0ABD1VY72_9LAMI